MRVKNFTHPILIVSPQDSLQKLMQEMSSRQISCSVMVEQDRVKGIVTESDIIQEISNKNRNFKKKAKEIMSTPVYTIQANASLEKANKIMDTKFFNSFPVVDKDNVIGMVTRHDIVHAVNHRYRFHRNVQTAVLFMFLLYSLAIFLFFHLQL